MKIKLYTLFFIVCSIFSSELKSQDAAFSQFYAAPVFLNPAMSGGENNISANISYRTNTNQILFPYKLGQFTVSMPILINSKRYQRKNTQLQNYIGSIAFTGYNELLGSNNEYSVSGLSITTSYFMQIAFAHFISFGLQGGFVQKYIDYSKLTWGSQFTPDLGYDSRIAPSVLFSNQKILYPVFNAGITWFYNINDFSPYEKTSFRTFAGIAVSNINKPDDSFFDTQKLFYPALFKFHGGLSIPLSSQFELLPNCLIMRQNRENHINVGTYIAYFLPTKNNTNSTFYQIQIGSWYRIGDSYIVSLGFEMKNLTLGISYDLNVSNFKYNNKGVRAFEVSINYKGNNKQINNHRNISHPII